ncbi:hypothetical protein ACHQM5_022723 [Ranunculus cassubicifolius]
MKRWHSGGDIDDDDVIVVSSSSSSSRPWDSICPEILSLILVRIPAEELIQVVQFVCKSWRETLAGPYCWTQIDIESWFQSCLDQIRIEKAVIDLVRRSDGTCTYFASYNLTNAAFSFVCQSSKCLKVLKIPESFVTDDIIIEHVESLKHLTLLDISSCPKITCEGLQVLGKNCTSLVELRRNMPAPWWTTPMMDEGEALVIADTMASLERLELNDGRFTDFGLDAILTKCKNLSHLDIRDSSHVNLESDDIQNKLKRLVVFMPPLILVTQNFSFCSDDEGEEYFSDFYSDSEDDL